MVNVITKELKYNVDLTKSILNLKKEFNIYFSELNPSLDFNQILNLWLEIFDIQKNDFIEYSKSKGFTDDFDKRKNVQYYFGTSAINSILLNFVRAGFNHLLNEFINIISKQNSGRKKIKIIVVEDLDKKNGTINENNIINLSKTGIEQSISSDFDTLYSLLFFMPYAFSKEIKSFEDFGKHKIKEEILLDYIAIESDFKRRVKEGHRKPYTFVHSHVMKKRRPDIHERERIKHYKSFMKYRKENPQFCKDSTPDK